MAKRNKAKFASKSRKSGLRIEALEQRQLLASITGSGTQVGENIVHPNGNVYDQVLMTGSSVTVTADAGQVTRVSFLDLQGDIVQAEFSGKGTLTISLDSFAAAAEATKYNQPGVQYVSGLASFVVQGSDASTNFSVFSVGSGNAVNQNLFAGGKTGGDNTADVARLLIVADPNNAGGFSTMGGIRAGNAVFSDTSGVIGISAANVNVQGPVVIGDIDAKNAGVPTLTFAANSQFATLTVSGGDLVQTNGVNFVPTGFTTVNSVDGTNSAGTTLRSNVIAGATVGGKTVVTLDSSSTFDLTGKTQTQIDAAFSGRTFSNALTVSGDLTGVNSITAAEFRGGVTFKGTLEGDITVTGAAGNITLEKGLSAGSDIKAASIGNVTSTGNLAGTITGKSVGNVAITGDLSGTISSDYSNDGFTTGVDKAVGNVSVTGNATSTARIVGILGIGNVSVDGNVLTAAGQSFLRTNSGTTGDEAVANIGTLTVKGDVNVGAGANLINIAANGVFGDVTISGGGSLGDTTTAINTGNIVIGTSLGAASAKTGNISITDTVDISVGTITAAGTLGTLGNVTVVNSSAAAGTDIQLGTINLGTGVSLGNVNLSGARTIATGAISAKNIGDIVINAGATNTVTIGGAINAADNVATGTSSIGAISLTGVTAINADINASTIGAVTLTGVTTFGNNQGFNALKSFASLTASTDVNFNATGGPNIQVGGTTGAFTFNGTTTFTNSTNPSIKADNDASTLDKIGSLVFNGRVVGAAGVEIQGSAIGDITVKASLNQGQALVTAFDVLATNNTSGVNGTSEETIARAGTDLANYAIGNVTVQSTNTIGVASTSLFSGTNSFVALGKIGDIALIGGGSSALQASLLANNTGAGVAFAVGDGDGLGNTTAQFDFNGDGDFGDTGENTADINANTTVSIGKVTINAAGPGDDLVNGGGAASGSDGLVILAGVRATNANLLADGAASNLTEIDAQLRGTIGEISIGNLSQLLAIDRIATALDVDGKTQYNDGTNQDDQHLAGVIAAANGYVTTSPITKVQGVTVNFDADNEALLLAPVAAGTADGNSVIIVRI